MSIRTIVEPAAKGLEGIAAEMEAAGIGGHPTLGHAGLLRRMAGSMRADASVGKMPHAYNDANGKWDASADRTVAEQPAMVKHLLRKAGIENPVTIDQLEACAESVDMSPEERISLKMVTAKMGWLHA
jgi:hypothetical protein